MWFLKIREIRCRSVLFDMGSIFQLVMPQIFRISLRVVMWQRGVAKVRRDPESGGGLRL